MTTLILFSLLYRLRQFAMFDHRLYKSKISTRSFFWSHRPTGRGSSTCKQFASVQHSPSKIMIAATKSVETDTSLTSFSPSSKS